jgi:hypothetical protein
VPLNGKGNELITVTDTGTFTGLVNLAYSALPVGVTAAFSSNPTATNSTLAFTAGSNAIIGTYPITVTGTSGNLPAATTSFNLLITNGNPGGFTLTPSVLSLNIPQGGSATDVITVADTGTFSGPVTISAVGSPTGVTGACGPTNPITGPGSCTLTVSVASSVPSGSASITVTGTSTTAGTVSFVIPINVTAGSGFTLSSSPSPLTVIQGATGVENIQVNDLGTFKGLVTLAPSGQPAGVTPTFATNPTTGASALSLKVASTAIPGTYPITVTGTATGLTPGTTSFNLVVAPIGGFSCHVSYTITSQWPGGFGASLNIQNTSSTAISSWTLTWSFANGQTIPAGSLWSGNVAQSGAKVTVTNLSYDGSIPANGSLNSVGFNGTWNNTTNAVPTSFAVNNTPCQ